MANEITQRNLSNPTEDLRLAKMISQEIRLLLTDSTNLRNTPFVDFVGSINGLGSDTIRVRKAGLDGFDAFSEFTGGTEIGQVSDSPLTDAFVDVVCKRNSLAYSISDMASMTGLGAGDIDPFRIADSIANSYDALFAKLTGATVGGVLGGLSGMSRGRVLRSGALGAGIGALAGAAAKAYDDGMIDEARTLLRNPDHIDDAISAKTLDRYNTRERVKDYDRRRRHAEIRNYLKDRRR